MRAGPVSAAALLAPATASGHQACFPHAHCGDNEYVAFLGRLALRPEVRRQRRNHQRRFARHCLRLPAEGPCECELYLTCSRLVITPSYAPRLRERHTLEDCGDCADGRSRDPVRA